MQELPKQTSQSILHSGDCYNFKQLWQLGPFGHASTQPVSSRVWCATCFLTASVKYPATHLTLHIGAHILVKRFSYNARTASEPASVKTTP